MNTSSGTESLFKQPSSWIPVVMSFAALVIVLVYAAISGNIHHQDEGLPAHIFQLIMVAQLPIVAYFTFKWLPKRPAQALVVLLLQAVAWIIPVVTIIWFESL
jgi:hypothetical protein